MTSQRKFFALALIGIACASGGSVRTGRAPMPKLASMSRPLQVVAGDADVQGTLVKAGPRGAVLTIGRHEGKVWLRPGTEASLGTGADGRIMLAVASGEGRLSIFAERRDVLVAPGRTTAVADDPELAGWAPALEIEREPAGFGTLEARGANGAALHLDLRRVTVEVALAGDMAQTRVEEVFYNGGDQRTEGTFRFPLPEGASLIGMSMEIDGHMMEGELVEREKARRTYESIVDAMRDPALLEWEEGNKFKMRVFPIEPHGEKKIVIDYLAPLHETAGGVEYVYPTAAPAMQDKIERFAVKFEGRTVVETKDFTPGGEIVVPVPAERRAGPVLRETRTDGIYTTVTIQPEWAKLGRRQAGGARRFVIVVDTSRSALEAKELGVATIKAVLGELGPADSFRLIACDVDCRELPAKDTGSATKALMAIDYDGATDLGAALKAAAALAGEPGTQILYIGDGNPTWGETDPATLAATAESIGAPIHAVVLGKGADGQMMDILAGRSGGRTDHPRSALEVSRFAMALAHADETARLRRVTLTTDDGTEIYPSAETTLYQGSTLQAVLKTPADKPAPKSIVMKGIDDAGREIVQTIAIPKAEDAPHVARRWAAKRIAELEHEGGHDPEVVELSLAYQVMSTKTSFLVLESEKMYEEFQIARAEKQAAEQHADPQVSGADLETVAARDASLSPDQIQPGDPEIRIPGREDARQVVVVFPFGETKVATWEPDLRSWTVRFLIDAGTPDGTYEVLVRITHADGAVEELKLSYLVDTQAPKVKVSLRPGVEPGTWIVRADQDASTFRPDGELDLVRVEVVFPDGRSLRLDSQEGGKYLEDTWRPRTPVVGPVRLRVVASDRALNQSVTEIVVEHE